MRPLALSCLLIVALTGTALAQTSTPESIAWTAYLAAEADDQSRIPELEAALPLLLEGETSEHRYALGSVAHALVRLKARPRLDLLPALFKRYPLETLLLLQRFGPSGTRWRCGSSTRVAELHGSVWPTCCSKQEHPVLRQV
jgi:hypothetical protein